ncbi:septum formation initiator family protein [Dysosmobacter sp.]|uniref:septum formation initiator family protein n=1 Tax=Dysosmobacter sp. TaxID=2591382 RepID=UPI002A89D2B5|nr:septum formation initiator family protein [Dysosmobacter sp.]MDY3281225.1 septum formation initiator family protein [Dysosmobacter sp.]
MAKTEKRPPVRAGFFTKVLLCVLLAALGFQLYHLQGQMEAARAQQQQLAAQVALRQQENDALQESIDHGGSEEEMKKIARDELGLVEPNEKVFYDTSN